MLLLCCSVILSLSKEVFAGTINLPKTGQTKCYDSNRTEIACKNTGQDGEIQAGTTWPNPRFIDNGNSTVTDNLTGLIWTKAANMLGPAAYSPGMTKSWYASLDYVACLNTNSYLGYNDWRLPNINELHSLTNSAVSDNGAWLNAQGFGVYSDDYWSSSTYANDTYSALYVNMYGGGVDHYDKISHRNFIWPVRGGQSGSSTQSNCTASTLSSDFKLHIPALLLGSNSYWLDLQYGSSGFVITGGGQS